MTKFSSFLINTLISLIALALCLGVVEYFLRNYELPARKGTVVTEANWSEPDDFWGWKNTPGAKGIIYLDGERADITINSQGFRSAEIDIDKSEGTKRLLILGDSVAFGHGLTDEDAPTQVLEQYIPENYQIINTAVGGYSTDQQLLTYQLRGKQYAPDLVVLVYLTNDTLKNNQFYAGFPFGWMVKPTFKEVGGEWQLYTYEQKDFDEIARKFNGGKDPRTDSTPPPEFLKSCAVCKLVYDRSKDLMVRLDIGEVDRQEYAMFYQPYEKKTADAWAITEKLLARLSAEAQENGSQLVISFIPERHQVYPSISNAILSSSYDLDAPQKTLRAISERHGIPFVDITPEFRRVAPEKELFLDHIHTNRLGNEIFAEALVRFLTEQRML